LRTDGIVDGLLPGGYPAVSQAVAPVQVAETAREAPRRLGPLSEYARRKKVDYFLQRLPKDARILDVGCGDNWFKGAASERGFRDVVGLDLHAPADIVGDLTDWRTLGLEPHSFDAIIAFEILEHGDFAQPLHDLLKPDGQLIVTTPLPQMDVMCRLLETLRLLQQRGSPHTHLTDIRRLPLFDCEERRIRAGISQWGILRPIPSA
jgi:SAM-dependent methyltransferase